MEFHGTAKNREIGCTIKCTPLHVHAVYIMLSFTVSVALSTLSKKRIYTQFYGREKVQKRGLLVSEVVH